LITSRTLEYPVDAQQILQQIFGYQHFRNGQSEIVQSVLAGRDCLVVMPTGGGKSLCYQIPALCRPGLALVVSPLISLMKDQVDQLQANGVAAAYLTSNQTQQQQQQIYSQCRDGSIKLLYIAPERLATNSFLNALRQWPLNMLAVDEAHCISQWGHDFRPEYGMLGRIRQHFPALPIMALTATADKTTRQDILQQLALTDPFIQVSSFDRPNIRYSLVEKYKPVVQIIDYLRAKKGQAGIIYCHSRAKVEDIAARLQSRGFSVGAYHAGLTVQQRSDVQEGFQRDDLQIVTATVAFGMGINKPNVRFVLHMDIPRNIESYYQETGRAGRDGLPAEAMLLYDPADMAWLRRCLEEKKAGPNQAIEQHKLNAMNAFAEAQICRRLVLLNYFDEGRQQPCNNCDICLDPPRRYDGSLDAQKVLSTIYRVEQRFGIAYVVDVLRGSANQRIKDAGHDRLPLYGLGKSQSNEHWMSVIRQLIHLGLITQNITRHSALQLTEAARPILRAEQQLQLAVPRLTIARTKGNQQRLLGGRYDKKLFARLRQLRKAIADEENIPPYVVFNDATLLELAELQPISAGEMLGINGVGQRKLERFGMPFMRVIKEYLEEQY
jgi:ATP-dependent DNA helicase RecQ